ncbi:hypothetical protein H2200_002128 [Cladophialophora chaetospira]|uniref:Uncharacterized protein n=1 Tax=Cladophialophora chaetospira TaxID=386627 RepID=A0AA38XIB0_9EURO|nr:hypothetical protein H2200_002128 [Cladophialophora chaetospira]
MPSPAKNTSSSTSIVRPLNWTSQHDAFVREKARHGEDAESIRILFEVEFPGVSVSKAWIGERMKTGK